MSLSFSIRRDISDTASSSSPSQFYLPLPTVALPASVWIICERRSTKSAASGSHPCYLFCNSSSSTWCCDQVPLAHSRLRRGFRSACESQLTLRITTRIPSVGSPATNSLLSHHGFCCGRNTAVRTIQIEEKALSMNVIILQHKERYLRYRIIIVSITILLAATNGCITGLSMDYLRASLHEICCIRVPSLLLILQFFLINISPLSST